MESLGGVKIGWKCITTLMGFGLKVTELANCLVATVQKKISLQRNGDNKGLGESSFEHWNAWYQHIKRCTVTMVSLLTVLTNQITEIH